MRQTNCEQMLIIGDSITLGATRIVGEEITERAGRTYVHDLSEHLPHVEIRVEAAVHRTTSQARGILDQHLKKPCASVVLLMVGGNDVDIDWKRFFLSEGRIVRHRVPVCRYADNLKFLVESVISAGGSPVLTDFPDHDLPTRTAYLSQLAGRDIAPWIEAAGGQAESEKQLHEYRRALLGVARETGVPCLSYSAALRLHPPSAVLSEDGVHPNSAGHAAIAGVVTPAITRLFQRLALSTPEESALR